MLVRTLEYGQHISSIDVSNKSEAQIVSAVKTKVSNGSCRRIINNKLVATNGDGMK